MTPTKLLKLRADAKLDLSVDLVKALQCLVTVIQIITPLVGEFKHLLVVLFDDTHKERF